MNFKIRITNIVTLAIIATLSVTFTVNAEESNNNVGGVDGDGASIKGVIKFEGKKAARKPIRVQSDAYCVQYYGDNPPLKETFIFGEEGTLANVFVWISEGVDSDAYEAPETPGTIKQLGCMYVPHVSGVMVNQQVDITNDDDTIHNVKTKYFNFAQNTKGMVESKKFRKPEFPVEFQCDVHAWMSAYLHVVDHPFFAVTNSDGTFQLNGLPAGEYTVKVWHEFKRFKPTEETLTVTIAEGESKEIEFTYKPPVRKKK